MNEKITIEITKNDLMHVIACLEMIQQSRGVTHNGLTQLTDDLTKQAHDNFTKLDYVEMMQKLR